jgi:hypothetical protein
MKLSEVKKLKQGDEVFWNDPDEGTCSRAMVIMEIVVNGDIVEITDCSGNYLECLAKELS